MKQTEITQFTPHFEGFIASESDVVAQKDWYGYHGKIDVGGYGGDNLYVREITATGYSAFSFRKVPQVPGKYGEKFTSLQMIFSLLQFLLALLVHFSFK